MQQAWFKPLVSGWCFGILYKTGRSDGRVELRRDEVESKWNKRHDDGGQVSERRGCDSQGAIGTGEAQLESHREAGSDKPDKASVLRCAG